MIDAMMGTELPGLGRRSKMQWRGVKLKLSLNAKQTLVQSNSGCSTTFCTGI